MRAQGQTSVEEEVLVVRLTGELDAGDPAFADDLIRRIGSARFVIVDLLNVSFIDSSVIRALVLAHRATQDGDGWLRVVYTHHLIRRVIEMCGLAEIFPQYGTLDSARRGTMSPPPSSETDGGHHHDSAGRS